MLKHQSAHVILIIKKSLFAKICVTNNYWHAFKPINHHVLDPQIKMLNSSTMVLPLLINFV